MKNSVVFYESFYEAIQSIPEEEQLKLYNAIFEYSFKGTEPQLDGIAKGMFTLMKPNIDSANARYVANVANGKKGGRPLKAVGKEDEEQQEEKNQQKPNKNPTITQLKPKQNPTKTQAKPKQNLNVDVDDDVDVDVDDNNISPSTKVEDERDISGKEELKTEQLKINDTPLQGKEVKQEITPQESFELLWEMYPRKEGKQDAYRHYMSWLKGKEYLGKKKKLSNREMWFAVDKYRLECKDKELRYIKLGSTFFNNTIAEYVEAINSE